MGRRISNGVALPQLGSLSVETNVIETVQAGEDLILNPLGDVIITKNLEINAQGDARFYDADSSNYVGFQSPSTVSSDIVWTLPAADGTSNQVLTTDGSGTLTWSSPTIDRTTTTTNSTRYITFSDANSTDKITGVEVNANIKYNPSSGQLTLSDNTASTSKTTGTLVVTGGVGISGAVFAANTRVDSLGVNTNASGTAGEIRATNAITAFYSDKRLKDIQGNIQGALDKVVSLNGVMYTQNKKAEEYGYNDYSQQVGLIAQEVQTVLPEIVKAAPFDIDENNNSISGEDYLTIQYERVIPLLVEAIKELKAQVEELKK